MVNNTHSLKTVLTWDDRHIEVMVFCIFIVSNLECECEIMDFGHGGHWSVDPVV